MRFLEIQGLAGRLAGWWSGLVYYRWINTNAPILNERWGGQSCVYIDPDAPRTSETRLSETPRAPQPIYATYLPFDFPWKCQCWKTLGKTDFFQPAEGSPLERPKKSFYLVFFNIDIFNENRMAIMSRISVETRAGSLRVESQTSEARLGRYIYNFGPLISHIVLVHWYWYIRQLASFQFPEIAFWLFLLPF